MTLPAIQWTPSPNFTAGRGGRKPDLIILHTTEGAFDGALSWLRRQGGDSSTHYLVSADGKRVAQLVKEQDTAWTAGNWTYNQRAVNIEQEGYAARGGFSDGLYQTVGQLVGEIAKRWGIPLDRSHIIGHMDVPNQDHTDPGPHYDFERVIRIAKGEAAVALPTRREDPVTGKTVQGGFLQYLYQLEDALGPAETLMLIGRPLTEEIEEDGQTVQYFERAVFEWHPGARPATYDVLLRRLGAEALARRGS